MAPRLSRRTERRIPAKMSGRLAAVTLSAREHNSPRMVSEALTDRR